MRAALLILILIIPAFTQAKEKTVIQRFHTGDWEKDIGYSEITQVGKTLYVSGVACGGENMQVAVNECYKALTDILNRFHTNSDHVVKENIYTLNIDELIKVIPDRKNFFHNENYPAATWVQVNRLYLPTQIIEIEWIVEL